MRESQKRQMVGKVQRTTTHKSRATEKGIRLQSRGHVPAHYQAGGRTQQAERKKAH